jgi:hypothetical protein
LDESCVVVYHQPIPAKTQRNDHHAGFSGQVKAITLVVLLVIGLTRRWGPEAVEPLEAGAA